MTDISMWDNAESLGLVSTEQFTASISNVYAGISYYYRTYATNSEGLSWASSTTVFKVSGQEGLRVREYDYDVAVAASVNPISGLQGLMEDGVSLQVNDLDHGNPSADFAALTDNNNLMLLWEGWFIPPNGAGLYTFGINHDDHTSLAIDLNGDGMFDDGTAFQPGELIVDGFSAGCCGTHYGTVNVENRPYRIAIGWRQGGGGVFVRARWAFGDQTGNFNAMTLIDGTSGIFFSPDFNPSIIANQPASAITTNGATFNAQLSASEAIVFVSAYWGPTDEGANLAGWANSTNIGVFTNVASSNLALTLSGLPMGTNTFYTFRLTNCVQDLVATPSVSVATIGGAPLVDNDAGVTNIGTGTATLQGNLSTGDAANIIVYWGDHDGGINPASWDNA
ncbi:MAG: hypothetical protein AAF492_28490, partial [Verrucomicrobiota bacterium]